eukprot:scaffold7738_cov133-Cylindrotheca_fusiformis.AAC.7
MRLGPLVFSYQLLLLSISYLSIRGFSNFCYYFPTRKCGQNGKHRTVLEASTQEDFTPVHNSEPMAKNYRRNQKISHVSTIRSKNLASVSADEDGNEIVLSFENRMIGGGDSNLVVVTGETGSGKSLLVSKVAELLIGGKMSPSLLHTSKLDSSEPTASVEMAVERALEQLDLNRNSILGAAPTDPSSHVELKLRRSLTLSGANGRIKSVCEINGHIVTLKALKTVGAPLLAIVNAPAAAAALARANSRMSMIDTGVPTEVLKWVRQLQRTYGKCQRRRQSLENELQNQILPVSLNLDGGEDDMELLYHWVDELDGFEARISNFCQSLSSHSSDGASPLQKRIQTLEGLSWMDSDSDEGVFSSSLYIGLVQLLNYLKSFDARIEAARLARDALVSMSAPDSARTALERTRQLLLDATAGDEDRGDLQEESNPVIRSSEKSHELLNLVEDALMESARFFDDDAGLSSCLETERGACSRSSDDVSEMIVEWNTLARKHGISPYVLPSCHNSLRQELDGNVEAKRLLPEAIAEEKEALKQLKEGTAVLSETREKLTKRISKSISERLPMLGMENSSFEARLRPLEDPSYSGSALGVEEVDFLLRHDNARTTTGGGKSSTGGKVELVASSGEKARILLAIECELPGSVRALCGGGIDVVTSEDSPGPVAVIYDEIDAHVGGRASVAVGQMLSDQSQSCQVVSITHSPSVAAIADLHICIHKEAPAEDGSIIASATRVEGASRRKELARMASGDMATEEAEIFAEALIRDVTKKSEIRN